MPFKKMEITSNSPFLQEIEKNQAYNINYGTLKKGANTRVDITIKNVSHLTVNKSCGCTMPSVEVIDNGLILTITYDSNKVGTINQNVKERAVLEDGTQKLIVFNLKGSIK